MTNQTINALNRVNENPEVWFKESQELLKKGVILKYDFEKRRSFASINLREHITDKIEHLRLTLTEVGELVGCDRRYISRYLHGGTIPEKFKERLIATLEVIQTIE
jgi:DNA transposition AAA+ family ATPase